MKEANFVADIDTMESKIFHHQCQLENPMCEDCETTETFDCLYQQVRNSFVCLRNSTTEIERKEIISKIYSIIFQHQCGRDNPVCGVCQEECLFKELKDILEKYN